MPWRTLCGFPPNSDTITLRIPNGAWRPDTVITDYEGTEMFVLLDQTQEMRSYEAVFGDLEGRRLVCIKRHLIKAFWRDGYYFCTYRPNYKGQKPLAERDVDNKKVYPFSYLQVSPMKGRFFYRVFDNQGGLSPPKMRAENPWLGFMVVCCTPMVRTGKWTASFKRRSAQTPTIHVDQWRNCVDVGPGNDLLAALCMAYVFDRYQCQPLVTVFGADDNQLESDDKSIASQEDMEKQQGGVQFDNVPGSEYRDHPQYQPQYDEFGHPIEPQPAFDEFGNPIEHQPQYDEFGNLVEPQPAFDEFGNPIEPQPQYDEFGNLVEPQPSFDELGNPIEPQPQYDEFGNPIEPQPALDEFGNPIEPQPQYNEFGNPIEQPQPAVDEFGNPIEPHSLYDEYGNPIASQPDFDEFGNPIEPQVQYDEFGNPIEPELAFDDFGNPIEHHSALDDMGNPVESTQPAFDEFGNPIELHSTYDEFGNPIATQTAFDEFGNPIEQRAETDEFGNPIAQHQAFDEFSNPIESEQAASDEFGNPLEHDDDDDDDYEPRLV